ncbi:putative bifunctional diguanylate cyclase/phosphodiesterase [Pseudoalteromonas 'SMAR']|uniref:putative bifunctional diguanylate cyclase/phosphodiesterase n=1 Tax=Pseudoalteromonas 'SMAR' TaxID=3416908 RepID=UPI003AF2E7A8
MENRIIAINLKKTLTWGTLAFCLFFSLIIVATSFVNERERLISTFQLQLSSELNHLAKAISNQPLQDSATAELINSYLENPSYITLFLAQNRQLVAADSNPTKQAAATWLAQPHNQQWLQEVGYSDNLSTQYLPAQQAIVATRTIEPLNATDTAPLQLIATYDLSPVIAELEQQFTVKLALLFLLLMALLTGLLVFIRRYIHSPINYLIKVGKQLTSQSLGSRATVYGKGEFAVLAKQLNTMAQALEENWQEQAIVTDKLRQRQAFIDGIFSALPDLFFIIDKEGKIIEYHAGEAQDLYIEPDSFINQTMAEVLPKHVAKQFNQAINSSTRYHSMTQLEYSLDFNGQSKLFEARLSPIPNTDLLVIAVRNITEKKRQEEVILHHAFYDTLTDLPNRFLALERLSQLLLDAERNKEVAVVFFIDLDDFKKINDSLGHEVGDKVLIAAGNRLSQSLRKQDTVARLGGDEFIVLMGGFKSVAAVTPVAEKLVKQFQQPLAVMGREFNISISLGVAVYPDDARTPTDMLSHADTAMYSAKNLGRNTYCLFNQTMGRQLNRRLEIEEALRVALHKGEFEVFYQPQFNISDRSIFGAEALLRWHSEQLGPVSPDEFIPVAEQSGLIIDIGDWVLFQAIQQSLSWQQTLHPDFRIAINLSPRQFKEPSLVAKVAALLNDTPMEKRHIELEITEGVLISGQSKARTVLDQLHGLGLTLSLDDFGTGYSSLNYLRHFPFDVLKVDKSFINDMQSSTESMALVKTIITMAHDLSMTVVAEGVETVEQLLTLQQLDCDFGQGYLISKPLSSSEFTDYYLERHSKLQQSS